VNITKRNYIEIAIDPNARVDETFDFDGIIVVDIKLSTIK